jgi:bacteriocin-like protein
MSDEIKKPEVNAGEEKQLDDKALEQVVGGDTATPKLYEALSNGKHISKVQIE